MFSRTFKNQPRNLGHARYANPGSSHGLRSLKAGWKLRRMISSQIKEMMRWRCQSTVQCRRLEQPLEHSTRSSMLKTLVGCQRVLRSVPPVAELAHVQRVRLLVLILEMSFQGVVTRECPAAVGTLLWLVDTASCRRGHTEGRNSCNIKQLLYSRYYWDFSSC